MTNREAIKLLKTILRTVYLGNRKFIDAVKKAISALEKQEKALDEWCPDCKEYDKEKHCCHRFSKVIRQTVEEYRRTKHEQT